MNIFEKASRQKLTFPSTRGKLTTEQLWDLPLTAKNNGVDLDTIARAVNKELREVTEESFVNTTPNKKAETLSLQLEILKFIIADKIQEQEDRKASAQKAAAKSAEKEMLMNALARKQAEDYQGMTKEQIEARIAALD